MKFQSIFNLTGFHYSRPSNKIYVAYFMYPVFLFRPQYALIVLFADYSDKSDHEMTIIRHIFLGRKCLIDRFIYGPVWINIHV